MPGKNFEAFVKVMKKENKLFSKICSILLMLLIHGEICNSCSYVVFLFTKTLKSNPNFAFLYTVQMPSNLFTVPLTKLHKKKLILY